MRLIGTFAALLVVSGCAPTGADAPGTAGVSARRCFSSSDIRLIKFEPGDGAYVRTRTGEALLLTGPAACLDVTYEASVGVRAVGLATSDICLGDPAHLDVRSHAQALRTCNVTVARVVPQSEIARLSGRQSP